MILENPQFNKYKLWKWYVFLKLQSWCSAIHDRLLEYMYLVWLNIFLQKIFSNQRCCVTFSKKGIWTRPLFEYNKMIILITYINFFTHNQNFDLFKCNSNMQFINKRKQYLSFDFKLIHKRKINFCMTLSVATSQCSDVCVSRWQQRNVAEVFYILWNYMG